MTPQQPAEGILARYSNESKQNYQVVCQCHCHEHDHSVWIESDEHGASVSIHTRSNSRFMTKSRWKQLWQLLVHGYVESEVELVMTQQQSLNYAEALRSSITKFGNSNESKD
jgi:hypothetical protein